MTTDGTETTVETVSVAPLLVITVAVTVSGPDWVGAGTVSYKVTVDPWLVVTGTETVTAGTLTVPPLLVVTETDGWVEAERTG
jgi:hypothetical protein